MTGTEMMRIANLNAMEVRVEVSENDIPRVSYGDEVEIEVDAYLDRKFKGFVTQIANSSTSTGLTAALTSDQVTNFEVRIRMDASSYADLITPAKPFPFRPGMSASVEINTEIKADIPTIPIQSVTTREKEKKEKKGNPDKVLVNQKKDNAEEEDELLEVVFIYQKADTVSMAEVKTGIQDDTYIEVLSGVKEGDEIVIGPYTAVSRKIGIG